VPVVRSVSANGGVGTVDAAWLSGGDHSGRPTLPVPGPWLTGSHSESASQYATFGKSTSFKNCSPSDIWIYADEDPLSINDACLAVVAATPEVVDYPSTRHRNASGFGFCDGHAEMHRWKSNLFIITGEPSLKSAVGGLQYQDWFWFAWHASRSSITGTVP
jgi:prepilin-type processing-associated H-X9-DG protein